MGRDLHGRGRWWATTVLARGGRLALKRGAQVRAAPEEPEKLSRSWRGKLAAIRCVRQAVGPAYTH